MSGENGGGGKVGVQRGEDGREIVNRGERGKRSRGGRVWPVRH